jgi:hypothetical protein
MLIDVARLSESVKKTLACSSCFLRLALVFFLRLPKVSQHRSCHSRPQSHFHSATRWKLGSGLLWVRRLKGDTWLASQRTAISQKLSSFRQAKLFYQHMSTQNFVSSYYFTVKIATGAKASQFKSMRFRKYCKFSCTSCSVCPRA